MVAESRGPKEDALLQHEFARLQLDGTSYIAPAWFRQQLHPGIHFEAKGKTYATGLQLADLSARPVAEKDAGSLARGKRETLPRPADEALDPGAPAHWIESIQHPQPT